MKSYKDVKRRIMALVVAVTTVLSSITIGINSEAEEVDGVPSGGAVAQVFTVDCPVGEYVQLTNVTLDLSVKPGQTVNYTATIHRNMTGGNPYSGTEIACSTEPISPVKVSANGQQTKQSIKITPSEDIYLTKDEQYSVVVRFESNMDILYVTNAGTGTYVDPGDTFWAPQDYGVMTPTTETVSGSPADEKFTVSLNQNSVCVDTLDVKKDTKVFTFQATLEPAYPRTVKYSVPTGAPFTVSDAGEVVFTTDTPACGTWTVTASVDGNPDKGKAEAKVSVVAATLTGAPFTYSGPDKPCTPTVSIQDVNGEVPLSNFTVDYGNNVAAGATAVTITGKEGTIYKGYSHQISYTIEPRTITQDDVNKGTYTIDTKTNTVTSAGIPVGNAVDGVTLVYNSERQDFGVVANKTGSKIKDKKLYYTYEVAVTGTYNDATKQGNSKTEGGDKLKKTVEVEAENSDTGKIDISTLLNVNLTKDTYTYTGKYIIPEFTAELADVTYDEKSIKAIATVEGSKDASETATVTIKGDEAKGYTGTVTEYFVIDKCSLNNKSEIELYVDGKDADTNDFTFVKTGEPFNPDVELWFNDEELDSDDYSVKYENCIYPGTMTIRITGEGNFTDTRLVQCTIVGNLKTDVTWSIKAGGKQYGVNKADFSTSCALNYTGSAQEVTVEGLMDGKSLDCGEPDNPNTDFSVKCIDNENPGTAKAIITGAGDYAGQEVTITYKIVEAPLANFGELWINPNKQWIYTGDPITFSSEDCKIGKIKEDGSCEDSGLKVGIDYELQYENNTNVRLGPAKVTAKAVEGSKFTGSLEENFTINPRDISDPDSGVDVTIESPTYNGRPQKPKVTVTYNGKELDESNYDVKATDNVKTGSGEVTVTGKNNLTGVEESTFTILSKDLTDLWWSVGGTTFNKNSPSGYKVEYTGVSQRPSIELRDGDTSLVRGEDYVVKYTDNKNPGKAHIVITWINGYKDNAPITIDFEVTPRNIGADNAKIEVTINGTTEKTVDGETFVFPDVTVIDKGLESGAKELVEGTHYELVESTKASDGNDYDLTTSGATKKAVVQGIGTYYTGKLETESYEIGNCLKPEEYSVRFRNPHTHEIETPDSVDGITRFFYLGKDYKPEPVLCKTNPTTNKPEPVTDTNITYDTVVTSSTEGADITSVYSPPNIVTVSLKGTDDYYGVVSARYLLNATAISGEINNVVTVGSKKLGEFDSTNRAVCKVPYTGDAIGIKDIEDDLTMKYIFPGGESEELKINEDYRLELVGTASSASEVGNIVKVKAHGQGNYYGSQEFTYEIVPRNLEQCQVVEYDKEYDYTGNPITPVVTKVIDPNRKNSDGSNYELVQNVDYRVICSDNTKPGTKYFSIEGIGNYQGELEETKEGNGVKLQFTINSKILTDKNTLIGKFYETVEYNGSPIYQTDMFVTYVGDGTEDISLTKGVDYEVTYSEDVTNPGKVRMTIKGINVYGGEFSKYYYIQVPMSKVTITNNHPTKEYKVNTDGTIENFDNVNDFILTYGGKNLELGKDYVIDTTQCKTPGEHYVLFKGIGKKENGEYGTYVGEDSELIKLYGDLSQATVKGVAESYAYTGSPVGPESVEVTYGEGYPVDATNYTITSSNNTNVGEATLKISPKDGTYYRNTKSIDYAIRYDLSEAYTELKIADGPHYYNKEGVKPNVTVSCKLNRSTLNEGTDYTLTYSDNKKAGTAYVTITPTDRSINSQRKSFEILQIDISGATVNWKTGEMPTGDVVEYKGTEWKPEVEVISGGKTLTYDVDYNVKYANNTNVGDATVTVVGKGNCRGTTAAKTFRIAPASLNDDVNDNLNIVVEDTYYNNGRAKPKIEVWFYGKKLTEKVDYDCEVGSPGVAPDAVMYPTTEAYVKFQPHIVPGVESNFKDTWEEKFEIKAINLNDRATVTLEDNTVEYTGQVISEEALDIQVVCKMVGQAEPYTLVKGQDYTINKMESTPIQNVGTYRIQVVGIGGFTGSWDNLEFKVTPRDLSKHAAVELDNWNMPYKNGEPVEPQVLRVYEDKNVEGALIDESSGEGIPLVSGVDYEAKVEYENNKNSASANDPDKPPTVIITGKGNYAGTEKRVTFNIGTSIEGAIVSLDVPPEGYTYDGKVHKPGIRSVTLNGTPLEKGKHYALTDKDDYISAGEQHVYIEGIEGYYGTAFGTYTIKASEAKENIVIELGGLDYNKETNTYSTTYTGSPIVPTVTVYDYAKSNKTPLEVDKDYTVNVENNVNAGEEAALVYVTVNKNYAENVKKQVRRFTILPKDISKDFELVFVDNDEKKYAYEDREIAPDIQVKSKSGVTLNEDEYSIKFSNNVNAGIANVTVEGLGNYTDTLSGEFMIVAALDDKRFTTITIEKQFYTGEQVEPSVTIRCGGNVLVQEKDFHVENTWNESNPDQGIAYISSLQEYYTCANQTIAVPYELEYSGECLKVTWYANEYTYTMSEIKPSFKITDLAGNEIESKKFHFDPEKITYINQATGMEDCTNVGTIDATIPVSVEGEDEITLHATYEIIPKNINACSITLINENTYTGSAIEPAVAIVYNGHELIENQEFTENYSDNINPGTATVALEGKGNYTGHCDAHFIIEPACMIDLTASPISESAIRIGWVRSAKVTGYEIFSADGRKKYGTTSDNFYIVDGLNTATSYSFKVRSYVTINGATSYGDALQVTACTKVGKVSVTGSSNAPGTATLVWNRYTSVAGYEVYRSTSSNGNYKKIADVPNAYGSYTDKKVRSGNTYYYKVRAYKPINGAYSYGDFSEEIKITIK